MATLRTYSSAVAAEGPLARWRFNEDDGTVAIDRAGNLNGVYQGGVDLGAGGLIQDGAASFDGVDDLTRVNTSTGGGPVRLGFLGDSLVRGFGLEDAVGEGFPDELSEALARQGFDIAQSPGGDPLFARGFDRATAADLIDEARTLAAENLDVVVLVIGTNDAQQGRDPAETKADLKTIIEAFQDQGTSVFLTKPLAEAYQPIFDQLASETGATLYKQPFAQPIEDNPAAFDQGDGIHPNEAGVDEIVDRMLPEITPLIDAAGAGGDALALEQGTLEMWVVPDTVGGNQTLASKDGLGLGEGEFRILIEDGALVAQLETGSGTTDLRSLPGALQANNAYHIALAFGAAGAVLYLNGQAVDSSALAFSTAGNTNDLLFAAGNANGTVGSNFDGTLDEVVVYDQTLTEAEVRTLYEAGQNGNVLTGTAADDLLVGAADDEILRGGEGDDVIGGNNGNDRLAGNRGADDLLGGPGNDILAGHESPDLLMAGPGNDNLLGGFGADTLFGGSGNDLLLGGAGNDRLAGQEGTDTLRGEQGADRLFGGPNDDRLFGGNGSDRLVGQGGDDLLDGGQGLDTLKGGGGSDTFRLGRLEHGVDRILDFQDGPGGDVLELSAVLDGPVSGANVDDFVRLLETNGNTKVQVNADGAGADFQNAFHLVGDTGLNLDQLVADGNVGVGLVA